VPMTRCPDCACVALVKRLVNTKEDNGNYDYEFVKCESKPDAWKVRSDLPQPISHFSQPISSFSPRFWELGFRVHLSDSRL
jgi:hypothetical protein